MSVKEKSVRYAEDQLLLELQTLRASLKRAEEANGRLAATLDIMPCAACVLDSKARLLYINTLGLEILGYSSDAVLIGRLFPQQYAHWAKDVLFKEALPTAARSGSWSGRLSVQHTEHGEISVHQKIKSQRKPDGSLFFSISFSRVDMGLSSSPSPFSTPTPTTPNTPLNKESLSSDNEEDEAGHLGSMNKRGNRKDSRSTRARTNKSTSSRVEMDTDLGYDSGEELDSLPSSRSKTSPRSAALQKMKPENLLLATRDIVLKNSKKSDDDILSNAMLSNSFGLCVVKKTYTTTSENPIYSIEYSNAGLQHMTGFSASELRGKSIASLWHKDPINHTPLSILQGSLTDSKECAVELVISCKGHRIARCRVSASPHSARGSGTRDSGRFVFFFSKYQETDTASPGSSASHILSFTDDEAVFCKIFESMDVGMIVWIRERGVESNRKRYRLLAINNKCDTYGVQAKAKASVGKFFEEINPELVDSGLLASYDEILNSGKPRHIGLVPLQNKAYKPCLFNVTGFPISDNLLGVIFEQVDASASIKPGIPYYPSAHSSSTSPDHFVRPVTLPPLPPTPAPISPDSLDGKLSPFSRSPVGSGPSSPSSSSRKRMRTELDDPSSPESVVLPPIDRALKGEVTPTSLASAIEAMDSGVFRLGFEQQPFACALLSSTGRIVRANNLFCHILGFRKEELESTLVTSIMPTEEARATSGVIAQVLASASAVPTAQNPMPTARFNLRTYAHKSGATATCIETLWLVSPPSDKSANVEEEEHESAGDEKHRDSGKQIMLLVQPVAGIKERFPQLFGDRMFSKAFSASPVAVGVFGKDGKLQHLNPALCTLLGYPAGAREALEGRGFDAFIHADDLATVQGLPSEMVSRQMPSTQVIVRCRHRDGSTLFCLMYLSLLHDDVNGATSHLVAHIQSMSALERVFRMG